MNAGPEEVILSPARVIYIPTLLLVKIIEQKQQGPGGVYNIYCNI